MTYGDLLNVAQSLNTGSKLPSAIDIFTKLILNKMSLNKPKTSVSIGQITVGGLSKFMLGSTSYLPDFMELKVEGDNNNLCPYYYDTNNINPTYLKLTSINNFKNNPFSFYSTMIGRELNINIPQGQPAPTTLYVPYHSKYLVLDKDGVTRKEIPDDNADTFLIPTEYESVLLDGIMLYLSRREKDNSEFNKNSVSYEKSIRDLAFYN